MMIKEVCVVFLFILAFANSKGIGIILNGLISSLLMDPDNPPNDEVQQTDVRFYLVNNENSNQKIELNNSTFNQVNRGDLVKVIVHGWLESSLRQWVQNMTQEYLRKGNYNVIQVDYTKHAADRYAFAVNNARPVGELLGNLIINLNINFGVPLENFHVIGHSLGAHVTGHAAKHVTRVIRQKLPRVTALDAAGPLFEVPRLLSLEGLRRTDANVVDAIHTDGGIFGYREQLGTVDFFPNGGTAVQPGCSAIPVTSLFTNIQVALEELFCSHTRSYIYFIESINNRMFVGNKCDSWNRFQSGACSNNPTALMGDSYSPEATGNFYLRT